MKIKDKNVKNILDKSIQNLKDAKVNTYHNDSISRQQIDNVLGILLTLVTLIDFEEDTIVTTK